MHKVSYRESLKNAGECNLAVMEIETIEKARLKFPDYTIIQIADVLGISERTLRRKAQLYEIDLSKRKEDSSKIISSTYNLSI